MDEQTDDARSQSYTLAFRSGVLITERLKTKSNKTQYLFYQFITLKLQFNYNLH